MLAAGLRRGPAILAYGLLVMVPLYLGLILLIVPGLLVAIYYSLGVAVMFAEGVGPWTAMGRSRALTKGHRWALLALYVVAYLLAMAPTFLLLAVTSGVPYLGTVLNTIFMALVYPLLQAAPTVAYHELRLAKEGLDQRGLARVFE
jgi:uncharacterized membrane protein